MNNKRQITNWAVDAALLGLFLADFFMDFTGLPLHQWLGVIAGAAAVYHLLLHRKWVAAACRNIFGRACGKIRLYAAIDTLMMTGLGMIVLTGLLISTWLNLNSNYAFWKNVHVVSSIVTLLVMVVKVGLHANWIVATTRRIFSGRNNPRPVQTRVPVPVNARVELAVQVAQRRMDRRSFLALMGVVGLSSAVALSNVMGAQAKTLFGSDEGTQPLEPASTTEAPAATQVTTQAVVQPSATAEPTTAVLATEPPAATATALPTAVPTAVPVVACQVRCPRGCSFPGNCRRYADSNGNQKCDLGECM